MNKIVFKKDERRKVKIKKKKGGKKKKWKIYMPKRRNPPLCAA